MNGQDGKGDPWTLDSIPVPAPDVGQSSAPVASWFRRAEQWANSHFLVLFPWMIVVGLVVAFSWSQGRRWEAESRLDEAMKLVRSCNELVRAAAAAAEPQRSGRDP